MWKSESQSYVRMKGRDRNKPCWCGSGKKYKKCHSNRDSQSKENPWNAISANKRAFSQKKCCAQDVGLGTCDGGIIKAHTVSRGPNLAKIARNGHVAKYSLNMKRRPQNGQSLTVENVGIRDASVFYGFCRKHDRELFSCIENEEFRGSPKQCLTIAYRTLSRELYGKDAGAHLRETLRGADKGLSLVGQMQLQALLDQNSTGNDAARRDLKATHDALTEALVTEKFEILKSVVFEFEEKLPFMFAGAWSPFTDLHGDELQKGYDVELLEQILVSSFSVGSGAKICVSWRDIANAPGECIAEQLISLGAEQTASTLIQFIAKHIENIFYNPDWFEGLQDAQRNQLDRLAADGIDITGSVPSENVNFDMAYGLPALGKSFYVEF